MKRKLVKHGANTLTISIPSRWAKANRLQSGQLLDIDFSHEGMMISLGRTYFSTVEMTLSGDKAWYAHRIFRHLYTYGYDEVIVKFDDQGQLALLRKSLEFLPGFEIVESSQKQCKIKCVTALESAEYNEVVNRLLWLIQSQFNYFVEDCGKGKPEMLQEVNEIYKTICKLCNVCRRMINKNTSYDSVTAKYAYRFLTGLMNISSFIIYSYDYTKKANKIALTKSEMNLVKTVANFYKMLLLAYQSVNVEKTKQFFDEREAMFDDVLEVIREKNPIVVHYFFDILKELSALGNFILILKINEENKLKPM